MKLTAWNGYSIFFRKAWMIMRITTTLLILITALQVTAKSSAQNVTLSSNNITVEKLFNQLKKQTGYSFLIENWILPPNQTVSVHVTNTPLEQVLDQILEPFSLTYRIDNKIVYILKVQTPTLVLDLVPPPVNIHGRVTDSTGAPLSGASVTVKGTRKGTQTDANGVFDLKDVDNNATLIISYTGYQNREVKVGKQNVIAVSMIPLENKLNDVVIVGYGAQSKAKVTGAIGSVESKDIGEVAVTGLDQALQGRLAGVQVTQNSGEPGGSVSVRIRGVGSINSTSEPLYVVDGIPLTGGLNVINPNDIERIDVLKDASSAAIYGSRGTNGVVLVTTKRGKAGKLVTSVDAYYGIQQVAKKIDLLNGPQFAKLANENLANAGLPTNPVWDNPSGQPTYDWQNAIFQTSPIHNINISLSSGGEKSRTFFSAGYFDKGGILVGSDYKRYTTRLNSEYDISKRIKVGGNVTLAYEQTHSINTNASNGILTNIAMEQPTSPIYSSQSGTINDHFYGWNGYNFISNTAPPNLYPTGINNVVYLQKGYVETPNNNLQILATVFGEVEIIRGLKLRSSIGIDAGNSYNQTIIKVAPLEIYSGQYQSISRYNEGWGKSQQWNWINTLSYVKTFGKHNFSILAGTDALKNNSGFISASGVGNPDGQNSVSATNNIAGRVIAGYPSDYSLTSYVGRLTYDFDSKYLFMANFRRDGSSKFGPKNQYGYFPSASVGWRISEENFMKHITFIDDMKLRASYGVVGNQNIPNFKYLSTYSNDGGTYQYLIGNNQTRVPAFYLNNLGDSSIHWEKSTQTDIGLDATFLKGKFTLTADYYVKKISDLLGNFPVPSYIGIFGNNLLQNGFSMENRGFEIALGFNQKLGNVNFSVNGNFSTLQNKVTKLTDNSKSYISLAVDDLGSGRAETQTRSQVGERIGNFWGYVTDGIFQDTSEITKSGMTGVSPGDRRYKDINGDGKVDANDKTILGNGLPKYIYGLSLRAEYGSFDISILLNGQAGVQIANVEKFFTYNMRFYNSTGITNASTAMLNSWHGLGTSNDMPRNSYNSALSNRYFSSYYIENGSFLRVRNIQVGYTLPNIWTKKIGMNSGRIYISAQNLYTFTKYSGYDPELGSTNTNPLSTGIDYGRYPVARTFMAGINFQF